MIRKKHKWEGKNPNYDFVKIPKRLFESNVWWTFAKNQGAVQVLMALYKQVHYVKEKIHPLGKKTIWVPDSKQNLVFTYEMAKKYGIPPQRFSNILKSLYECGFIDVIHFGSGQHKDMSLFKLSDRWRKYGTNDFIIKLWPKSHRTSHSTRGRKGFIKSGEALQRQQIKEK